MAWIERDFCHVWSANAPADQDFIDDACFQLNFWKPVIQAFFDARNANGNTFLRHIDGRTKTRIRVKANMHTATGVGLLGRLARPTSAGPGYMLIDQDFLRCCRNVFDGTVTTGTQGATTITFTMADRYWALLELSSIILHELNHVVWNFAEERAYCMEGFFRQRVQADLGIASFPLCGQTTWPCGACVGEEPGCRSGAEMAPDIADISGWPTIAGCP